MTTPSHLERINSEQLARRDSDRRKAEKRRAKRARRAAARSGETETFPNADPPKRLSVPPKPKPKKKQGERFLGGKLRAWLGQTMRARTQDRCQYRRRDTVTGRIKRLPGGQEVAPCGGKMKGKGPAAVCRRCGRTALEGSS